jgi:hypothetical protein
MLLFHFHLQESPSTVHRVLKEWLDNEDYAFETASEGDTDSAEQ